MRHPAAGQHPFAPMTAEAAQQFRPLIEAALVEDGAFDDVTSNALIPLGEQAQALVILRSSGVVAGLAIAALTFAIADQHIAFEALTQDGAKAGESTQIARVRGSARGILAAERVALNLLGRLSGIAALTRAFVDAVSDLPVRICDTRKTTPGLRELERYAVRAGGGFNHRFNLSDAVLIKDNHLAVAESVAGAVAAARTANPRAIVEVECDALDQVQEAVSAGVDTVLLDNMTVTKLREAVALVAGRAVVEASGGMTLGNVRDVAMTGVNVISVGALTHSAPAANVALDFVATAARTQ